MKIYPSHIRLRHFKVPIELGVSKKKIKGSSSPRKFRTDVVKRKRDKLYDIVCSNEWSHFGTLTLDSKKINRYDYSLIVKKITNCFRNFKYRYDNDFKYVLVPEKHKDGAYHFHGLFFFSDDKHLKRYTRDLFYFKKYNLGYNSFSAIKNLEACRVYILKYISKTNVSVPEFKRTFFYSLNCEKPTESKFFSFQYDTDDYFEIWDTNFSTGFEKKS